MKKYSIILMLLYSFCSLAQTTEVEARAKFLSDLTRPRLVDWPTSKNKFLIGIVKHKDIVQELKKFEGDRKGLFVKNLTIEVEYYNSIDEIKKPDILYVNHDDFSDINQILKKVKGTVCLVVGENYDFNTSMINFVRKNNHTFFEINEQLISPTGIVLKEALKAQRANNESEWRDLLSETEVELENKKIQLEYKEREIKRKEKKLIEANQKLEATGDSLEATADSLNAKVVALEKTQTELIATSEKLAMEQKIKYGFIAIILLSMGLLFFVFRNYRNKQKLNLEILLKNKELKTKNKEILDSIYYAENIQQALLPSPKKVSKVIPNSFILFKPKDIVSGDFYWMQETHDKIHITAADCTGHGVPGALVSMVGHDGLNRCIKEFQLSSPEKIMDKLNEIIDETFENAETEVKDGMDMAFCTIHKSKDLLEYSGANNPLYLIRKKDKPNLVVENKTIEPNIESDNYKLFEIKADKQPIGKYSNRKPFTSNKIELMENDTFYTFSDGYADQFGGDRGKKFKYKPFKNLLIEIQEKDMQTQRELILTNFELWRGNFEQIDDVVVIGIRI